MIIREKYLSKIRPFYDQDLIKVIMGVRRCGKSVILLQIIDELKEKGIPDSQIIYINFEYEDYAFIKNDMDLHNYIKEKIINENKYYLFFDEIQRYKEIVTKIKFLVEDQRYRYILSASLLGVEIVNLKSAPVGYLKTLQMYPLDFEEFLQLFQISDAVFEALRGAYQNETPVDPIIHKKMLHIAHSNRE